MVVIWPAPSQFPMFSTNSRTTLSEMLLESQNSENKHHTFISSLNHHRFINEFSRVSAESGSKRPGHCHITVVLLDLDFIGYVCSQLYQLFFCVAPLSGPTHTVHLQGPQKVAENCLTT